MGVPGMRDVYSTAESVGDTVFAPFLGLAQWLAPRQVDTTGVASNLSPTALAAAQEFGGNVPDAPLASMPQSAVASPQDAAALANFRAINNQARAFAVQGNVELAQAYFGNALAAYQASPYVQSQAGDFSNDPTQGDELDYTLGVIQSVQARQAGTIDPSTVAGSGASQDYATQQANYAKALANAQPGSVSGAYVTGFAEGLKKTGQDVSLNPCNALPQPLSYICNNPGKSAAAVAAVLGTFYVLPKFLDAFTAHERVRELRSV